MWLSGCTSEEIDRGGEVTWMASVTPMRSKSTVTSNYYYFSPGFAFLFLLRPRIPTGIILFHV